jgi:hypothetical protein
LRSGCVTRDNKHPSPSATETPTPPHLCKVEAPPLEADVVPQPPQPLGQRLAQLRVGVVEVGGGVVVGAWGGGWSMVYGLMDAVCVIRVRSNGCRSYGQKLSTGRPSPVSGLPWPLKWGSLEVMAHWPQSRRRPCGGWGGGWRFGRRAVVVKWRGLSCTTVDPVNRRSNSGRTTGQTAD